MNAFVWKLFFQCDILYEMSLKLVAKALKIEKKLSLSKLNNYRKLCPFPYVHM